MEKQTLMGRVKRAVTKVGVPVAARLAKGAVAAVAAVQEAEKRVESELRKRVSGPATPVTSAHTVRAATRKDSEGQGSHGLPQAQSTAEVSHGPKVKRGQKHRHHR